MSIILDMLPQIGPTYKSTAFNLGERVSSIFLKYGLYATVDQLEEAMSTVYNIAEELGDALVEEDVKVIVIEKEKSIIPLGGLAVANVLSVPTLSIGEGLKLPKINDPYYNIVLEDLEILPVPASKGYLSFDHEWLFIITYDSQNCRSAWFRYNNNSGKRYVMCIDKPPVDEMMNSIHSSSYQFNIDKQFSDKQNRVIRYWYEDNTLEENWPEHD